MSKIYRIIDANLNRAREGTRVVEDVVRFYLDKSSLAKSLKALRHDITGTVKENSRLISSRSASSDVGRGFDILLEGKKKDIRSIVVSNLRRVEESLRVLEEVYKISNIDKAKRFKKLRFKTYRIEKNIFRKI